MLKEKHGMGVLGRIFGPKRDEVIEEHSGELHNLDLAPSVIRMTKSLR
jgi:hypothetical protein